MVNFEEYLNQLSSNNPTPGGGSAACNVLSIASALLIKSLRITMKRKSYENHPDSIKKQFDKALELLSNYLNNDSLSKNDENAFNNFMIALKTGDKDSISEAADGCFTASYDLLQHVINIDMAISTVEEHIVASIDSDFQFGKNLLFTVVFNCIDNARSSLEYVNGDKKDKNQSLIDEIIGKEGELLN